MDNNGISLFIPFNSIQFNFHSWNLYSFLNGHSIWTVIAVTVTVNDLSIWKQQQKTTSIDLSQLMNRMKWENFIFIRIKTYSEQIMFSDFILFYFSFISPNKEREERTKKKKRDRNCQQFFALLCFIGCYCWFHFEFYCLYYIGSSMTKERKKK